ncbi:hypothetical protein MD273_04190 [Marinobacter pelagius]|uniref:hypothetical protein n=1 Tax=Marinobacter sp. C7 TaxID=2951363 RepID=UPI001EF15105|nr:hypothetical protein [Marinobacter sp. C7]MCG7198923.1 hypothetical protein [Marinobacter sp. C7]
MTDRDEAKAPGTAGPAKIRKAACGIRFDEDELQEGIDFSGAAALKPDDPEPEPRSANRKDRKPDRHA